MFIPTGIFVAGNPFADLQDRKHSAHRDVVEGSNTADHRQTIVWNLHSHRGHIAHAGLAHRHVAGEKRGANFLVELAGLDADHVWKLVTHLRYGVMGHVAVHRPIAWLVSDELDGSRAPDLDEDGRFDLLRRFG